MRLKHLITEKKILLILIILLFRISKVHSQIGGAAGAVAFDKAAGILSSYFDPAARCMYAGAAVCGLVGAWKIYSKFIGGEPDATKNLGAFIGGGIFLLVAGACLQNFFGTN